MAAGVDYYFYFDILPFIETLANDQSHFQIMLVHTYTCFSFKELKRKKRNDQQMSIFFLFCFVRLASEIHPIQLVRAGESREVPLK